MPLGDSYDRDRNSRLSVTVGPDFLSRSCEAKKAKIKKLFGAILKNGLINYLTKYEGQILKIVDGINFLVIHFQNSEQIAFKVRARNQNDLKAQLWMARTLARINIFS